MLKKLTKFGNSNALVLDKTILSLLGLKDGSFVQMEIHGDVLKIRSPKSLSSKDRITTEWAAITDGWPEELKNQRTTLYDSFGLNPDNLPDNRGDEFEAQRHAFKEYWQSEKARNLMQDLHKNKELVTIQTRLVSEQIKNKLPPEEFSKLWLEEVKKHDINLHARMLEERDALAKIAEKYQ
tara:strand:- start:461 stop:1003 length:543 start_codon:yes stop_codon:yes gene_type:complete